MEAFESFVGVALEAEGFVVSSAVKFPVTLTQTHGYEVDLVGARADCLVLATVKSFLGSRGVVADHVTGDTTNEKGRKMYLLLNHPTIRDGVIEQAARRYRYDVEQVELRLYVGRFAGPTKGTHEKRIRRWAAEQHAGGGPIKVFWLSEVVGLVRAAASHKQYRDNPVLVTMKVLDAAGMLTEALPDDAA